jgi:hypothetical protein
MANSGLSSEEVIKGLQSIIDYVTTYSKELAARGADALAITKELKEAAETIFSLQKTISIGNTASKKISKVEVTPAKLKALYKQYEADEMNDKEYDNYLKVLSQTGEYKNLSDAKLKKEVMYWRAANSASGIDKKSAKKASEDTYTDNDLLNAYSGIMDNTDARSFVKSLLSQYRNNKGMDGSDSHYISALRLNSDVRDAVFSQMGKGRIGINEKIYDFPMEKLWEIIKNPKLLPKYNPKIQ